MTTMESCHAEVAYDLAVARAWRYLIQKEWLTDSMLDEFKRDMDASNHHRQEREAELSNQALVERNGCRED